MIIFKYFYINSQGLLTRFVFPKNKKTILNPYHHNKYSMLQLYQDKTAQYVYYTLFTLLDTDK